MPSVEDRLDDIAAALRAVAASLEALRLEVVQASAAAAAPPAAPGVPASPAAPGGAAASASASPTVNVFIGGPSAAPRPQPAGEPEPAAEPAPASNTPSGAPAEDGPARRAAERAAERGRESPRIGRRGEYVYAVWRHPTRPDVVGVHAGGIDAWYALERTFPGGRYAYHRDGILLRRFESLAAGFAAYAAERERHGAPAIPPVWVHPLPGDL